MLALAQRRMAAGGLTNVRLREGRAESLPAEEAAFDVVLASLSDVRAGPGSGSARDVAGAASTGALGGRRLGQARAVRYCPLSTDRRPFAGPPPVPGVGPGALADPTVFLQQLAAVGMGARVEQEALGFA